MVGLDNFFNAKKIAIVGVSKEPNKVGHVIFRNLIDSNFKGKIFVVNKNADTILNYKSYPSLTHIKEKIDLVIIAVPAEFVIGIIHDCYKTKVHHVVIITSGFSEIGNYKLENKLRDLMNKYRIKCVGVNGLGVFDAYTKLDTLFLPRYRLQRPKEGGISFVCQSGAVGSTILDLGTEQGYGFSKFISYGNATNVDESDLIDYLGNDEKTKVICLYVEGIKNGRKFIEIAKKVSKKKPIIALKGGITEEGSKATLSHTGSLAGAANVYMGIFKQCNIIKADSLQDMFNYARILEKSIRPMGSKVQVITNGGGFGILSTDAIINNELKMAELNKDTKNRLTKIFPKIVIISNPMDLVGDADTNRYKLAIEACIEDNNIDVLLIILLYQTPLITTDVIDVITEINDLKKKPIIVVSTGGEFTEVLKKNLEMNGVPTFTFPEDAVKSIKQLVNYYESKS